VKIEIPKKHIIPTPENRAELVDMIKYGLLQTSDQFTAGLRQDQALVSRYLLEKNTSALPIAVSYLFFNSMGLAINSVLGGDASGWEKISAAYSEMYWAWEVQQHDSVREGISFDFPTQCEISQVIVHSLSLLSGSPDISKWSAAFLKNLIKMGGAAELSYSDESFPNFYLYLLDCQLENSFRSPAEPKTYGGYYPLINALSRREMFSDALCAYCDFRLARAFQYGEMGAKKPRSKNDFMYLYERHWLAILPFEIYALQSIYQNITGSNLSLDVEHPLLATPFACPPRIHLIETKLSQEIFRCGSDCFGSAWKPLNEIALI
jgi:hypothetical protein